MKTVILLLALAAYVTADHHVDAPSAPAPAPASSALNPAPISDAHQHYSTPAGDNGYYYYYYPVEEPESSKASIFDVYSWSKMTWLIVSLTVVGLVLLAPAIVNAIGISAIMAALGLPMGRTFDPININYSEMADFARNVYNAVEKKY